MRNRAVLYLRLSKEDSDKLEKGDDSASIRNQRLLLTDYALGHGFQIVEIYSDDDESGLYDDRPDFVRMMTDAQLGLFDIIISKSQSRFSRNMEHIEKYLHHDLPKLGIRFIGIVDGVDTAIDANKKARQINGLVNEWYCEDLSKSVRSGKKAMMGDGMYVGSHCPYGYVKDPNDYTHLIIDEYAANVVREIYKLYLKGNGKAKIGAILSRRGILIPTKYKREVLGLNYHNSQEMETTKYWSYQTIHNILNNRTYLGHVIQNRWNTVSYKDKTRIALPEEEWIVRENRHDPIIDKETFEKVQQFQKIRSKSVNADSGNGLFSGLIFCADCKHAMSRSYERRGQHKFKGYVCKTYKNQGKQFCESHSIDYVDLEDAILHSIKSEAQKILKQSDVDELQKIQLVDEMKKNYEFDIKNIQKQIEKMKKFKRKTYDNFLEELITKEEYLRYVTEYDNKVKRLESRKDEVLANMNVQKELDNQYDEWIHEFSNYINIDTLTREIVLELIKRIEVHNDGVIDVYYRFSNPYEQKIS